VQKIGNIELPLHNGKEEWMAPLYKWIAFYTDEVKDFLDRLADVEDQDGSKNSSAVNNCRKTKTIGITTSDK